MNTPLFLAVPVFLADIIPPPPDSMAGPLGRGHLASLVFWALAIAGAAGLWWLRRRRSKSIEQAAAEPK